MINWKVRSLICLSLCLFALSCGRTPERPTIETQAPPRIEPDIHSYSNPQEIRVRHVDLDLEVLFQRKALQGAATLDIERGAPGASALVLDTRGLKVDHVETAENDSFTAARFEIGVIDPVLGAPLKVEVPPAARRVRIHYATSAGAAALQWLSPAQTAGRKHPFLFTQSQAINARSWIPIQDTPGVRITYTARIRTPKELVAVMSAENHPETPRNGDYRFEMKQAVPSYLLALAVGDLEFRSLGKRTGVYAEKPLIDRAAKEFEDTEKMIQAAEQLYGPYRWGRYDLLVLPPSFPFGGMENPRLTFATPTIIAGDKSLVSLVAHELAHSWSGNLVTNATWSDFWLNEGFTMYVERQIQEKVYGKERAEMEASLGRQELMKEMARLGPKDQVLHVDLTDRNPDDGFTSVPYEKGYLFLRHIASKFGQQRFNEFLKGYFDRFAFQSITTGQFLDYLTENLLAKDPQAARQISVKQWVYEMGLPAEAPQPVADAFVKVDDQAASFAKGETPAASLKTAGWGTHEWLHFLRALPEKVGAAKLAELDAAFQFTKSGNNEVLDEWLVIAIRNDYKPAYPRLDEFLTMVGRRKYVKPLYEELVKTPEGRRRAKAVYAKARPGYHPITQSTVDGILK